MGIDIFPRIYARGRIQDGSRLSFSLRRMGRVLVEDGRFGPRRRNDGNDYTYDGWMRQYVEKNA